jgi:hypothetical protein
MACLALVVTVVAAGTDGVACRIEGTGRGTTFELKLQLANQGTP